jgi:teichoic acid transport system permease protein
MPFVMRTWMYASGVFYSAQTFAEHVPRLLAILLQLNPMLVYIELVRGCLLAAPPPGLPALALWPLGVGWALVVGIGGYVFFWRGEEQYGRG